MEKFKNKYRIPSARLPDWDYGNNAWYYVTICTKHRHEFFGEVIDHKMNLNCMGRIANQCWINIPKHFKFIHPGKYVIMPDHVHGIIEIDKTDDIIKSTHIETTHPVETTHALPSPKKSRFRNQGKNTLSSIIGSYKSAVTKLINRECIENRTFDKKFAWAGTIS